MRLEENHENWLKFANDYWEIDNGLSAIELGKDMIMKHVKKARDSAYGYTGELDETLTHADKVIEATDRDNLKVTVDSLCDLGEFDAVTKALKNVTLGTIMKSTGVKPTQASGNTISPGVNRSLVAFNGQKIKRGATKTFNDVVDASTKSFNRVVSDSVNINASAKSILKEAMARKADGRLVNPTNAASTLKTTSATTEKGKPVTKFADDEETWTNYVKQEATGRMKSDTDAAKTVEIPVVRLNSFEDTRDRLPPEFSNPKKTPNVVGMTITDLPKPNTIKGGAAATYRRSNQENTREGQWPANPADIQYPEETASSRYPNSRW